MGLDHAGTVSEKIYNPPVALLLSSKEATKRGGQSVINQFCAKFEISTAERPRNVFSASYVIVLTKIRGNDHRIYEQGNMWFIQKCDLGGKIHRGVHITSLYCIGEVPAGWCEARVKRTKCCRHKVDEEMLSLTMSSSRLETGTSMEWVKKIVWDARISFRASYDGLVRKQPVERFLCHEHDE